MFMKNIRYLPLYLYWQPRCLNMTLLLYIFKLSHWHTMFLIVFLTNIPTFFKLIPDALLACLHVPYNLVPPISFSLSLCISLPPSLPPFHFLSIPLSSGCSSLPCWVSFWYLYLLFCCRAKF